MGEINIFLYIRKNTAICTGVTMDMHMIHSLIGLITHYAGMLMDRRSMRINS